MVSAIIFIVFVLVGVLPVGAVELSVPAQFAFDVKVPGQFNQILRPSSFYFDHNLGEFFVADPGNNRIVIFDPQGTYLFEFSGSSHFSTPLEVAVDKDGYIWVLSASLDGRYLTVFDFDGLFLRKLPLPTELDGIPTQYSSFDLDGSDNIYLVESNSATCLVLSEAGAIVNRFDLLQGYTEKEKEEEVAGRIKVCGDIILVPFGVSGAVNIYSLSGKTIGSIGYKGSNVGALAMPVAAVLTPDSTIMVLDKLRQNVVCYGLDGKFKGEFGGKGTSPGWFYHPTLLEVGNDDHVYIGQIFDNKIQACRIPEFIYPSHETGGDSK